MSFNRNQPDKSPSENRSTTEIAYFTITTDGELIALDHDVLEKYQAFLPK